MPEFFDRDMRITIGGATGEKVISYSQEGLRMAFDIEKTPLATPNRCSLTVYNLSASTRQRLNERKDTVVIEAGYTGFLTQIFRGAIFLLNTSHDGPDWLSNMVLLDYSSRASRVNRK